ncbi:MAG: HU family DNA-binding protein [Alloprevotella sp.]
MIQYVIRSIKSPRTGESKYFPQIAPAPPVMRKELIQEIEQKTTLTSTDVKACLDALEHAISNHLVQGQAVRLGDLGSFRPTLASKGVDSIDKCDSSLIKRVRCRFTMSATMTMHLKAANINFQPYKTPATASGE